MNNEQKPKIKYSISKPYGGKMSIRSKITKALKKRYKATIAENLATIEIYLENPVGIGDHPGAINEIDGLLEAAVCAQDKLNFLENKVEGSEDGD